MNHFNCNLSKIGHNQLKLFDYFFKSGLGENFSADIFKEKETLRQENNYYKNKSPLTIDKQKNLIFKKNKQFDMKFVEEKDLKILSSETIFVSVNF